MVHFGFSYIGVIWLIMLFVPNGFWAKNKPTDYDKYVGNENKILLMFERAGEVLCSMLCLIFSDFNIRFTSIWSLWLLASFILMVLYELYWIRYFKSGKTMADMYSSYAGFPVAGASLPCVAFLFLGIYGTNIFMIIAALILSVGHIGIHLMHRKEVVPAKPVGRLKKVLRVIAAIPVVLILLITFVAIAGRNINWFKNYIDTSKGVNECIYVPIGGQEQYMVIRGKDVSNPVILYLHGGPAGPDSPISNTFTDPLVDDYTVVCWDQRGCGRTYFRNKDIDPDNSTVSYEQALSDVDQVVDYLRDRFDTDKVIVIGHSYGSLIGSVYAHEHPEKVTAFIGIGQVVDCVRSDELSYQDALSVAASRGEDTSALEAAYAEYLQGTGLADYLKLRTATEPYHPAELTADTFKLAFFSPYSGVDDIRWFMVQMDFDGLYELNRPLYDMVYDFSAYDQGMEYEVPVFFISGDRDFTCNYTLAEQYCNDITAPAKGFVAMHGCGHCPHYILPEEWAQTVKDMLSGVI